MNEWNLYSWLAALAGIVMAVAWRFFHGGDTLTTVSRNMDSLELDTKKSSRWDSVGEFFPRHHNRAIMRLCILQMQLLTLTWWLCLILTVGCVVCIGYVALNPDYAIRLIESHAKGDGLQAALAFPLLVFLALIVITFFVAGYKRRLQDLTEEMRGRA